MAAEPIRLKVLLQQRHWQTWSTFCREYDRIAHKIDPSLAGSYPSRAQLHRWLSGELKSLPYPHHCQILEGMLPGWTVAELFAVGPIDDRNGARPEVPGPRRTSEDLATEDLALRYADVIAVYPTRSAFTSAHPVHELFDNARTIRAAGLSLNLLCQHYSDTGLFTLANNGTEFRLLLLDPDGEAIKNREQEEGYEPRFLSTLNELNLGVLRKVRKRLPADRQPNMQVALYDDLIRFNIILIDETVCIVQPYLAHSRGVDSPTMVIERNPKIPGLYATFEQVFTTAWEGSRPL